MLNGAREAPSSATKFGPCWSKPSWSNRNFPSKRTPSGIAPIKNSRASEEPTIGSRQLTSIRDPCPIAFGAGVVTLTSPTNLAASVAAHRCAVEVTPGAGVSGAEGGLDASEAHLLLPTRSSCDARCR